MSRPPATAGTSTRSSGDVVGSRRRARREAWKTFEVVVTEVRGSSELSGAVYLSHVTGIDGTPYLPRLVWRGVLAHREPHETLSPEQAAALAQEALRQAYPGLI